MGKRSKNHPGSSLIHGAILVETHSAESAAAISSAIQDDNTFTTKSQRHNQSKGYYRSTRPSYSAGQKQIAKRSTVCIEEPESVDSGDSTVVPEEPGQK
jgi:hypothetical protein